MALRIYLNVLLSQSSERGLAHSLCMESMRIVFPATSKGTCRLPNVRRIGWQMDVSPEGQRRPYREPWAFVLSRWRATPGSLHISLESISGGRAQGGELRRVALWECQEQSQSGDESRCHLEPVGESSHDLLKVGTLYLINIWPQADMGNSTQFKHICVEGQKKKREILWGIHNTQHHNHSQIKAHGSSQKIPYPTEVH